MTARRKLTVLTGAAALLIAGWMSGLFGAAPPVYDGLPLTAEPYRYLQPPAGLATTAAPTSITQTFPVAAPASALRLDIATLEVPPQATVSVSDAAFAAPLGTPVTVSLVPVPPPAPVPSGRIDGNVYRLTVTTGASTPVGLAPGASADTRVELRSTGAAGEPVIEFYDGAQWHRLPTTHVPPADYAAEVPAAGDFALVLPPGSRPGGGPGSGTTAGIVLGAFLIIVGGALAVLRGLRRRSKP